MKTALLIIDHGSRRDAANRDVESLAASIRDSGPYPIVEFAHMELAQPDLATAFASCVAQGAVAVVIVPYFLAGGNHVSEDIPGLALDAAAVHPGVTWRVTPPLGPDERLERIVLDRAAEALAPDS